MESAPAIRHLEEIFTAALRGVDPYELVRRRLSLRGGMLAAAGEGGAGRAGGGPSVRLDLDRYRRILVLGAGKASARMAQALEEILGDRLEGGLLAVPAGSALPLRRIRQIEAGHPVPDEGSVRAGREAERMAREAGAGTLFINLISGGGSALLAAPLEWEDGEGRLGVSLADKRETTRLLLACGATIQEINCIRKHLSALKGGRLAARMAACDSLNLILSDVVGDRLDSIASGLTAPDETTWADALSVVRRYGLEGRIPPAALAVLRAGAAGRIPDTPKAGDPAFARVRNVLVGANRTALRAAGERAARLGYNTCLLSSRITGEAREVARVYYGIGRDIQEGGPLPGDLAPGDPAAGCLARRPACLLAGGETTVTVRGGGRGGRNQELALAFLAAMAEEGAAGGLYLLSASTDGIDGPTDAAGAFAGPGVLEEARRQGLTPCEYLARNDSHAFFQKLGGLLRTGPTHTNVCDLQILIVP